MGIYIKGMEMPMKCADCEVLSDDLVCPFTGFRGYNGKPEICPLIEIPPHGDLIDRDEQIERAWRLKLSTRELIAEMLKSAPTIIPEERRDT